MSKLVLGAFASSWSLVLFACASPLPPASPQPAVAIAAAVEALPTTTSGAIERQEPPAMAVRVRHHVEVTIDHLPRLMDVDAQAKVFVLWVRGSEEEGWANAAHLDPGAEAQSASFSYVENDLFVHVTAEASADARIPSPNVLLSTRVSKDGACASSVDQNDLKMRVRMCRDEK